MNTFASIVGFVVVMGLSLGMVGLAWGTINECLLNRRREREEMIKQLHAREIGRRILDGSWWFSQDQTVQEALNLIGQSMIRTSDFDVSEIREQWRKKMTAPAEQKQGKHQS